MELFAQIGKAGSDISAFTEAIARLISTGLRSGVDPQEIADQLLGIGGSRAIGFGPNRVRSVPDAIGQFLDEYLRGAAEQEDDGGDTGPIQDTLPLTPGKKFGLCPQCGTWNLVHVEGAPSVWLADTVSVGRVEPNPNMPVIEEGAYRTFLPFLPSLYPKTVIVRRK